MAPRYPRRKGRITLPTLKLKSGIPIDYKDLELLGKCLGSGGQILSRKRTGLSAQRQKELKKAIKRARHLALLPFVG